MYYVLHKCKQKGKSSYNKWYAKAVSLHTINLDALISHMARHHTGYSEGIIAGVIRDMVSCIKELILAGNNVKIDNLAIFSGSIKNKKYGSEKASEYDVKTNVECVKVKAIGTGQMNRKQFQIDSSLEYAPTYAKPVDDPVVTPTNP